MRKARDAAQAGQLGAEGRRARIGIYTERRAITEIEVTRFLLSTSLDALLHLTQGVEKQQGKEN